MKEYAPYGEHILPFNSRPYLDVVFSTWKKTHLFKSWFIYIYIYICIHFLLIV